MRSALLVRALLALAAAFLLGGALLVAPTGSATPDGATAQRQLVRAAAPGCLPRCWSAISFNPKTLRGGWTQSGAWGGKAAAMRSAHNHCQRRPVNATAPNACQWPGRRKVVAKNACVAVAWLTRNERLIQWTKASAYGPRVAMRKAKQKLSGRGVRDAGYSCPPRRF